MQSSCFLFLAGLSFTGMDIQTSLPIRTHFENVQPASRDMPSWSKNKTPTSFWKISRTGERLLLMEAQRLTKDLLQHRSDSSFTTEFFFFVWWFRIFRHLTNLRNYVANFWVKTKRLAPPYCILPRPVNSEKTFSSCAGETPILGIRNLRCNMLL